MRGFGIIVAIGGVIGLMFALAMDTSVSTGYGSVNNIGLMADRQNYMVISGIAIIAGILLALFGPETTPVEASHASGETPVVVPDRACPHCAEIIKAEARKCRYCGSEVEPTATKCDWCVQSAPAPHKPCSHFSPDERTQALADVQNLICKSAMENRGSVNEPWDGKLPPIQH